MAKRFLVLTALLMLGFFIAGCAEGDKGSTVTNPNPDIFSPTGSISGVVVDGCTSLPVKGAVVTVAYGGGVHSVTTSTNGAFSFTNVPSNNDAGYEVLCDLTKNTLTYGFSLVNPVQVSYTSLGDGTNSGLGGGGYGGTESGSGANTPVNKLAATTIFRVATLTATIKGKIVNVSTGRADLAGIDVYLYRNGSLAAAKATTNATGEFTLGPVMPHVYATSPEAGDGNYSIGFTSAIYENAGITNDKLGSFSTCNTADITCTVPCGTGGVLDGIVLNVWENPDKDRTAPYITSINLVQGTTIKESVYNGDQYEDITPSLTTMPNLVLTFNEAMNGLRDTEQTLGLQCKAYVVVFTSAGTRASGAQNKATYYATTNYLATGQLDATKALNIVKSFRAVWNSAGLTAKKLVINPTYQPASYGDTLKSNANVAAANLKGDIDSTATGGIADADAWGTGVTYTAIATTSTTASVVSMLDVVLTFPIEWDGAFVDANGIPWCPVFNTAGAPITDTRNYLHNPAEAEQDLYILDISNGTPGGARTVTFTVTVGQ